MNHPAIQKDNVAVITGGAVGIGFAIADMLCSQGMNLILLDCDKNKLADALSTLQAKYPRQQLTALNGDVTSSADQQALLDEARKMGKVSLLVNNAAIVEKAGPWQQLDKWQKNLDVNFWSVLALQHLFVTYFVEQDFPTAIVNLGSKEGITTPPGNTAYSVAKAALKVLTEHLEHELRESTNGRVSAHLLIPGYTYTPMNFPDMTATSKKPEAPWTAAQVAQRLLDGMAQSDFYIFCEDNEVTKELDQKRMQWSADDIIKNRPALSRWHPDYRDQFAAYIS